MTKSTSTMHGPALTLDRNRFDTAELRSALDRMDEILGTTGRKPVVFLDYDGTLTPIVSQPEDAVLSESMRDRVRRLAAVCPVAVISGRDLADVRARVGLDELIYAGSHGFDIEGPRGLRREHEEARASLPALDAAELALREQIKAIPGARVERKRFSIAIHFRNVPHDRVAEVEPVVEAVRAGHEELRRSGGKKIHELQPAIDWHKGRAVVWLLEALQLDGPEFIPLYVGDDLTDEDAFRALAGRGVGVVVRDEPRETAAGYALEDTDEVGRFLEQLGARLSARR